MLKKVPIKELSNIYIALGSNEGNKFEFLQKAVDAIFNEIGTILKISPLYQTPAMGFEGADFLNCVLCVQSAHSPKVVLKKILAIEKELGRERKTTKIFVSRPIDIDILFVDDLVKTTKKLTIPHPEIQNRKFVLQPMADINSNFYHPVFHKKIIKLLSKTVDKSAIEKQSKWLRNPLKDYEISKYKFIAIEGNIGSGKTSLATQIANDFNSKLILEQFSDNPFLPKFYQEPARYAFPLEMSFLASRYQQLLDDIAQCDLFTDCVIADYDAYKSLIFAKITLQEEEFSLYKKLFQVMHKDLPKPDLYVYLYQNTDRLLEQIKKRGRKYEQSIDAIYLEKIHHGYMDFIKSKPNENVKIIDVSGMDFIEDRKNYLRILKEIVGE